MTGPDHIQGPPLRDDGPLETMQSASYVVSPMCRFRVLKRTSNEALQQAFQCLSDGGEMWVEWRDVPIVDEAADAPIDTKEGE